MRNDAAGDYYTCLRLKCVKAKDVKTSKCDNDPKAPCTACCMTDESCAAKPAKSVSDIWAPSIMMRSLMVLM